MSYWSEAKARFEFWVCLCKSPHERCPRKKLLAAPKINNHQSERLLALIVERKQYGQVVVLRNEVPFQGCYGGKRGRKKKKKKLCKACDGSGEKLVADVINTTQNCTECGGGGEI